MSLPKTEYPMYTLTIPSTKAKCTFRPFLVKEEKLLLMAKEGDNPSDVLSAIKQVVNNCCLTPTFNINALSIFDLEYLFLRLRGYSVDNIIKVIITDEEDNRKYEFSIDTNKVEVEFPDKIENVIKINSTTGIIMKYPSASLYDDADFLNLEGEPMFELIIRCLDKVYEGDTIHNAKDYKKQELADFLDNLNLKTFDSIQQFLLNSPKIKHVINYVNSLGKEKRVELTSLNDFFT